MAKIPFYRESSTGFYEYLWSQPLNRFVHTDNARDIHELARFTAFEVSYQPFALLQEKAGRYLWKIDFWVLLLPLHPHWRYTLLVKLIEIFRSGAAVVNVWNLHFLKQQVTTRITEAGSTYAFEAIVILSSNSTRCKELERNSAGMSLYPHRWNDLIFLCHLRVPFFQLSNSILKL